MIRRDFLGKSGTCLAGLVTLPVLAEAAGVGQEEEQPKRRKYKIDIEIFEVGESATCHAKGEKFEYPKDIGKICPWLLASMHDFLRLLQNGVTLSWKYEGTPYEKVIDPAGVTTEYVRCPDPTADLVAKITRTAIT
jgi:uncharacterized repeat protein (TIGR04076 family)